MPLDLKLQLRQTVKAELLKRKTGKKKKKGYHYYSRVVLERKNSVK